MIGIDTNIIVRWITQDDPAQCIKVEQLFNKYHSPDSIFISDVVLIELEWVLDALYGFKRNQIAEVLEMILRTTQFSFRNSQTIFNAICKYRKGFKDFSDCMIGESGNEFELKTYTFDKALKHDPNFVVIK